MLLYRLGNQPSTNNMVFLFFIVMSVKTLQFKQVGTL